MKQTLQLNAICCFISIDMAVLSLLPNTLRGGKRTAADKKEEGSGKKKVQNIHVTSI